MLRLPWTLTTLLVVATGLFCTAATAQECRDFKYTCMDGPAAEAAQAAAREAAVAAREAADAFDREAARIRQLWDSYQAREKSLLEQVMNYSSLAIETGTQGNYAVAGLDWSALSKVVRVQS